MPARTAFSPRGIPRNFIRFLLRLPQCKIQRILLHFAYCNPGAVLQIIDILSGQLSVVLELPGAVVHISVCLIGIALIDQRPDEINDFRNVFGHLRVHVRRNHVQRLCIFEVFFYVLLGYLRSGDSLFLGPANNLVIHISEILHELHIISSVFEIPAQCIEHHERSGISNVEEIVYGRSADVDSNLPLFQRHKFFLAAGHGIVYLHRFPFPRQISPAVPIRLKTISGSLHHPIQNPVQ